MSLNTSEFMNLASRYLDCQTSVEETAQLAELIRLDPEARLLMGRLVNQHVALRYLNVGSEAVDFPAGLSPVADRTEAPEVRRSSRAVWMPVVAAAASVLLIVGVWWIAASGKPFDFAQGRRQAASGDVVARAEKVSGFSVSAFAGPTADRPVSGKALKVGDEVRAGDRIETGKDGAVTLAWVGEATTVVVGKDSKLEIGNAKWGRLTAGNLVATVAKQTPGRPFVVETPQARVTVLGTKFSVRVSNPSEANASETSAIRLPQSAFAFTRLDVAEGLVRFSRLADDASTDVPAGSLAVMGKNLALKPYPAGTEYVDGEVLFADSFNQGLAGYDVFTRENERQPEILRPYDAGDAGVSRFVRLGEAKKDGLQIPVVIIDVGRTDASAGISLREPSIPMGDIVMEYDVLPEKDYANPGRDFLEITPTAGTAAKGGQQDTRSEKVRIPIGSWASNRIEHVVKVDASGRARRYVTYKWNRIAYHEGVAELPGDDWKKPTTALACRIDVGNLRVRVANYTIRRLVRVPAVADTEPTGGRP